MSNQGIPSDDARRKRACQQCIRAKAKCSPSDNGLDDCYRCQRLNKECVFEDSVRRKGPKSRSRVKALEQRVESLVDLITTNNATSSGNGRTESTPSRPVPVAITGPPDHHGPPQETPLPTRTYVTPTRTPNEQPPTTHPSPASVYEPVAAGALDHDYAEFLFHQFRDSVMPHFPFVVIDASVSVDSLRQQQPFLFHAIMAVMTYATPSIQDVLNEELQKQIASRIFIQGHKSLEILQGLLVHVAWYHYLHDPKKQQLGTILQLCVAQVLDLGLSRNRNSKLERSPEEKRAYLGTYYMNSVYAQTWRKCNTLPHSKFMVQCYQSLSTKPEYPSDTLIAPMIQSSELMCRVCEHFSYNDIPNADIKGQMMLESATSSFCSEMERIKDSVPMEHRKHTTLDLRFDLLCICIHECSLHSALWPSHNTSGIMMTAARSKMLHRTMQAVKSYLDAILALDDASLFHLTLPSWCGWFYSHVINCKVVFVAENRTQTHKLPDGLTQQPSSLLPDNFGAGAPHDFYTLSDTDRSRVQTSIIGDSPWHPAIVAEEAQVEEYFQKFVNKLHFTLPTPARKEEDSLFGLTCLLLSMRKGFTKQLRQYSARHVDPPPQRDPHAGLVPPTSSATESMLRYSPSARFSFPWTPDTPTNMSSMDSSSATSTVTPLTQIREEPRPTNATTSAPTEFATSAEYVRSRVQKYPVPLIHTLNFTNMDFGTLEEGSNQAHAGPAGEQLGQENQNLESGHLATEFGDWVWDAMMEDWSMPAM